MMLYLATSETRWLELPQSVFDRQMRPLLHIGIAGQSRGKRLGRIIVGMSIKMMQK